MRKLVTLAVLTIATQGTEVRAGDPGPFGGTPLFPLLGRSAGSGPMVRTATIDSRTGTGGPAVTRLQPVIGSVQRTSHFTNPFTHKARYTSTVYNPVLGTFGTQTFRQ